MGSKILVVDDEPDVVEFLRNLLEDNGYDVGTAGDGVEAMRSVADDRPDLILLDLQMPEETGTGFYRKLRNRKELRDIPVIVVSGLAGRDVAVSKSVVVIDKPPGEEALLEEVRKLLQLEQTA
jgi:CheY-like chemotaxis protein